LGIVYEIVTFSVFALRIHQPVNGLLIADRIAISLFPHPVSRYFFDSRPSSRRAALMFGLKPASMHRYDDFYRLQIGGIGTVPGAR
jgi:hypothetical protein